MVNLLDLKFQTKLDLGGGKGILLRIFYVDRPEDFGKQLISVVKQTGHDDLLKLPGVAHIRISREDYAVGLATFAGADSTLITRDHGRYSTPAPTMRRNVVRPNPRPSTGDAPSLATGTPSKHGLDRKWMSVSTEVMCRQIAAQHRVPPRHMAFMACPTLMAACHIPQLS